MKKYFGLAREKGEFGRWYNINFLFWHWMLKVTLYTKKTKLPKLYFYKKQEFEYCVNEQEFVQFKWFVGVVLNYA